MSAVGLAGVADFATQADEVQVGGVVLSRFNGSFEEEVRLFDIQLRRAHAQPAGNAVNVGIHWKSGTVK